MNVVGFPTTSEQTNQEVRFVADALGLPSHAKVLDLCCGYGRHSYFLSKSAEYHVMGLDLSADFLSIAHDEFSDSRVHYVQADMRQIPFVEAFDAVISLFTSFGFFATDDENREVLLQIHRVLKKEGLLLLDYENKYYFMRNDVLAKNRDWQRGPDGEYYLIENAYNVVEEREVFRVKKVSDGRVQESGYDIRLYSFPELKKMLEGSGFRLLKWWGDFDGSEFSVTSRRLISLSRKK